MVYMFTHPKLRDFVGVLYPLFFPARVYPLPRLSCFPATRLGGTDEQEAGVVASRQQWPGCNKARRMEGLAHG